MKNVSGQRSAGGGAASFIGGCAGHADVMLVAFGGQAFDLQFTEQAGFAEVAADLLLPAALEKEQGLHLGLAKQAKAHGFFAEAAVTAAIPADSEDVGFAQPAPASGDIPQHRSLAALPNQGVDQGLIGNQPAIVEIAAEFQPPSGDGAAKEMARRRPPCRPFGPSPGLGPGAMKSAMGAEPLLFVPMFDKGLHQIEGFANLTEKLGLAVLNLGIMAGEEIGMILLGLFAKSGLDPPGLQVAEKIEGQMDLGTEQGSAGRKDLIFVEAGQHADSSPFAARLKFTWRIYTPRVEKVQAAYWETPMRL